MLARFVREHFRICCEEIPSRYIATVAGKGRSRFGRFDETALSADSRPDGGCDRPVRKATERENPDTRHGRIRAAVMPGEIRLPPLRIYGIPVRCREPHRLYREIRIRYPGTDFRVLCRCGSTFARLVPPPCEQYPAVPYPCLSTPVGLCAQ